MKTNMSCTCLRRVISLWHQITDLSPSLAFFAKFSNTYWPPTLLSTLTGSVSGTCMTTITSSMISEKRSCKTQHIMFIEDLARNASVGKQTDIVVLDFSKAFDKVNQSKLSWKMHEYGIRGRELAWIRAFPRGVDPSR